jgi:hypothetical protein
MIKMNQTEAPHHTKLFHSLLKQIDHKSKFEYNIKTNIWKSEDKTYIEIDIKRDDGGIMFYVLKKFIDRLKEHGIPNYHHINIWAILPAEDGFITLSGKFEE